MCEEVHTDILSKHCDVQAVEKEVNERLAIMRKFSQTPVKKLLLWLLFAYIGTIATLWLSASLSWMAQLPGHQIEAFCQSSDKTRSHMIMACCKCLTLLLVLPEHN